MKFKGTKGNWFSCCTDADPHYLFANENGTVICKFTRKQDGGTEIPIEEMRANAILISKAPEMLAMIDSLCEELEFHGVSLSMAKKGRELIKESTKI